MTSKIEQVKQSTPSEEKAPVEKFEEAKAVPKNDRFSDDFQQ